MHAITITDIIDRIQVYAPDADVALLMEAYQLAAMAHTGQFRKSGEPYLQHPIDVAGILVDMRMDVDTVATALLHDALEDNPITKEEMAARVGPVIAELVDGVTKIGKLKFRSKRELQAENFRKMMIAMSRDLRVILVKLADRLHNMRTLYGHKPDKRREIAQETIEVYAPIANRLGLNQMKSELEDLCFEHLEPETFTLVKEYLDRTAGDRDAYIERVVGELRAELDRQGIEGDVSGRAKALSSIWRKMRTQDSDVKDVPDLLAFRLLVPSLGDCYVMLGIIHASWEPVPGRIKDYIARSKPNGYQSLHTTVVGPEDRRVEVQIRTHEMHRVAEEGIAAHWQYKEGHLAVDPKDVIEFSRIREAFETAQETDDATEFMETVKKAFYADEVFVFTPAGEVKRFPLGATPLDFAYSIHSDIGDTCVGARANGRMVSLDYELHSGDSVEIVTNPHQHPRRDWLEIAKTSSAIAKIRRWLRRQEEETALRVGREILGAELERFGWTLDRSDKEGRLKDYLKKRSIKTVDPLLGELARGTRPASEVAKEILPDGVWQTAQEEARRSRISDLFTRFTRKSRSPVLISGEDGILVHYAGCCNPLPGEPVAGFITRGRGISVHQRDCDQLQKMDPERRIPVEWDRRNEARHSNTIQVWCDNRPGMISQISKVLERLHVNIEKAEARGNDGPLGLVVLQVAVRDYAELQTLMADIKRLPDVSHVERLSG